jgi:hypothetical protein
VTSRTIIGLAVVATALLAVGARLFDTGSAALAAGGALLLVLGTGAAAAAVAGAWRPVAQESPGSEAGPTESASHSSSGRMARQSDRTDVSALRVPQSADGA